MENYSDSLCSLWCLCRDTLWGPLVPRIMSSGLSLKDAVNSSKGFPICQIVIKSKISPHLTLNNTQLTFIMADIVTNMWPISLFQAVSVLTLSCVCLFSVSGCVCGGVCADVELCFSVSGCVCDGVCADVELCFSVSGYVCDGVCADVELCFSVSGCVCDGVCADVELCFSVSGCVCGGVWVDVQLFFSALCFRLCLWRCLCWRWAVFLCFRLCLWRCLCWRSAVFLCFSVSDCVCVGVCADVELCFSASDCVCGDVCVDVGCVPLFSVSGCVYAGVCADVQLFFSVLCFRLCLWRCLCWRWAVFLCFRLCLWRCLCWRWAVFLCSLFQVVSMPVSVLTFSCFSLFSVSGCVYGGVCADVQLFSSVSCGVCADVELYLSVSVFQAVSIVIYVVTLSCVSNMSSIYLFQAVSVAVSVLTLSCISVERWYAICFPLLFRSTPCRAKAMILVIWLVSMLLMLPELIVLDTNHSKFYHLTILLTSCRPTWDKSSQAAFQLFITLGLYVLPFGLMFVTYIQIARCLWSNSIPTETS